MVGVAMMTHVIPSKRGGGIGDEFPLDFW